MRSPVLKKLLDGEGAIDEVTSTHVKSVARLTVKSVGTMVHCGMTNVGRRGSLE